VFNDKKYGLLMVGDCYWVSLADSSYRVERTKNYIEVGL